MPWAELSPMELRRRFVGEVQARREAFAAVCKRYGISRKTGYKWQARFESDGREGLLDRPRIAKHVPHALAPEMETLILWARELYPSWGPKKLNWLLEAVVGEEELPALSTIGGVLRRHGLVKPPTMRRRQHVVPYPFSLRPAVAANDVWTADFKGDFLLGNGARCYPFTLEDFVSRYLLRCDVMPGTLRTQVQASLTRAFQEYGLPTILRTDNGVPFVGTGALAGLSELSVWLMRLGIWVERTRRGSPQDNGRHERMHRTLKAEACSPPKATPKRQQSVFDSFVRQYNEERPHESLGFQTPSERYTVSSRRFPRKLPEVHYAIGTDVRRVSDGGGLHWRGNYLFLTKSLRHQHVALTTQDGRHWLVCFGQMPLAYVDDATSTLIELPRVDSLARAA